MPRISQTQVWLTLAGLGCTIAFVLGSGWLWVLLARNPLDVPVAGWVPWPVACTTRGCITTWEWQRHEHTVEQFAEAAEQESLSSEQTLTTLVRQHLAHHSQLRTPVSRADARRYREDVLNLREEGWVVDTTGLTLEEYDQQVIRPFLEQESIRQQRRAESADDLYQQLGRERWIVVLPFGLYWSDEEGRVVR